MRGEVRLSAYRYVALSQLPKPGGLEIIPTSCSLAPEGKNKGNQQPSCFGTIILAGLNRTVAPIILVPIKDC